MKCVYCIRLVMLGTCEGCVLYPFGYVGNIWRVCITSVWLCWEHMKDVCVYCIRLVMLGTYVGWVLYPFGYAFFLNNY